MASNLSTIGFHFSDDGEFAAAMTRLAEAAGERIPCGAGEYAVWRCRSGASIWFQLGSAADGARELVGLTPFFDGKSEIVLRITDRIVRDGDTAFEGAFYAWAAPGGDGEGDEGAYPCVVDAVDFDVHAERELPLLAVAEVAGFAQELKAFPSEEAYAATHTGEAELAPQAFVPVGLFSAATGEDASGVVAAPSALALITGRVAEHRLLTNSATGQPFHWLLVESYAATYDILADPSIVAGEITVGGTVEATCVMFCRLIG